VQTATWIGRTIPRDRTALGAALRGRVGSDGYVARHGAVEPDVTSIAAPVYGPGGTVVAAISVLAPSYRTPEAQVAACGRALARHAAELSRSLGAADGASAGRAA
jgi:IclR family transcriptional regulator, KDG regulon repressor